MKELVVKDSSGHDINHILKVYDLAMKFVEAEKADKLIVGLAALLHEVDDYKIVGREQAKRLTNARRIMNDVKIDKQIQEQCFKYY